jgi:CBS domain-containing protein
MTGAADDVGDRDRILDAPLWRDLGPETVDALLETGAVVTLEPGEAAFRAGEAYGECIYIHLDGEIEQISGGGDVRLAEAGDLLGLANYLDAADYRSTARARGPCRLLCVPERTVRRLERESPPFFEAINRALAARMRKARQVRESVRGTLGQPVRQFMHTPLAACGPETSLAEAFDLLAERRIGSLGVIGHDRELLGLLTPVSIADALIHRGARPADSVLSSACLTPLTVMPDTPLWRVEEIQQRNRVKYVVVVDEQGDPIGMVSQTDLVRGLASPPQTLDSDIAAARDLDEATALFARLPAAARRAHDTHRNPSAAVRALSDLHLALQHRAIELVLADLERAGRGPPPARFAMIIMGSGGRGEMLLHTDQDNALILEDGVDHETHAWFERFAEAVNPALDRVGYALCPGGIMARNPEFRMTLSQWRERISRLAEHPAADGARWSSMVFDFATQFGDDTLTAALQRHVSRELQRSPGLLKRMVRDDAEGRPALGLFNRLQTTRRDGHEGIDIKRNGLRIVVDAARVLGLRHGVTRTGTVDRLAALGRLGALDRDLLDGVRMGFEEMLDLLLAHQLEQVEHGEAPDKFLRLSRLSGPDRERLRISLRAARRLQERLQDTFGVEA